LDSDALPLSIDLEQFEYNVVWLEWIDYRDPCCGEPPISVNGTIDSITIFTTVPEPGTLALLGLGLLGLSLKRRRSAN
jgi:hypothetical protein